MNAMTPVTRDAYLRLPDVRAVTGLGRSTIYRRIEAGEFPHQYDLGGGVVAWKRSEIEQWLDSKQPRRLTG